MQKGERGAMLAEENSRHFATPPLVSPARNNVGETTAEMCHYPDLGSDSDWSNREGNLLQPIRSTTRSVISMEFLQSFLRRYNYFAGKPVVASRNVGCLLRLGPCMLFTC